VTPRKWLLRVSWLCDSRALFDGGSFFPLVVAFDLLELLWAFAAGLRVAGAFEPRLLLFAVLLDPGIDFFNDVAAAAVAFVLCFLLVGVAVCAV